MTDPKYMRLGLNFAVSKAVEEMGELTAALGKTIRWGWLSYNPELDAAWVDREIDDVLEALGNLRKEMASSSVTVP